MFMEAVDASCSIPFLLNDAYTFDCNPGEVECAYKSATYVASSQPFQISALEHHNGFLRQCLERKCLDLILFSTRE